MTASQGVGAGSRLCGGGGLEHEDPLGAGHPAVLVPPRDRIPGDPLRTPVPTLVRLRLGAGRTPALLMLNHTNNIAGLPTSRPQRHNWGSAHSVPVSPRI